MDSCGDHNNEPTISKIAHDYDNLERGAVCNEVCDANKDTQETNKKGGQHNAESVELNDSDNQARCPFVRVWSPEELASNPRHTESRVVANTAYLKNAMKRRGQSKKRQNTENLSVGDFVTVKIPKQDRHKFQSKRLPAVIVKQHGKKRLSFTLG
ncbi:PREDICTED: uncharacterized protein LOC106818795 [Priapulus caudatus]|uniref:Uncharacterized protein LOC106818795 n=1 Tax=Priapulus caudatus TaxID=37621 RepID=A0ABM1F3D4_PRICU|nr:PREDICTED: uncharacterized protein LOC106818795 [Priapulus caudatus]